MTSEAPSTLFMKAKTDTVRFFLLSNAVLFFLRSCFYELSEKFCTTFAKIDIFISNRVGTHSTYQSFNVSSFMIDKVGEKYFFLFRFCVACDF